VKNLNHGHNNKHAIILCVFRGCIIIHFDYLANPSCKVPESLDKFLHDPKFVLLGLQNCLKCVTFWNSLTKLGFQMMVHNLRLLKLRWIKGILKCLLISMSWLLLVMLMPTIQ
ncbi:Lipoprotein, partial [Bienertia sinuspersici]